MRESDRSPGSTDRLPKGPRDRLEEAMEKLHGDSRPASEFVGAGPEDLDPPDDGPDPDLGPEPGFDDAPFSAVEEIEGVGELFTF
jgi:hypothetical protein